jgi:spore germination protein GerM
MAVMETRFQSIEEEQQSLRHRLSNVETRTVTTDENIRAMMAHWKITPAPIKRKFIDDQEYDENSSAAGNAILLASSEQGQGANCF